MHSTYANLTSLVRFFGLFLANANLANANFSRSKSHVRQELSIQLREDKWIEVSIINLLFYKDYLSWFRIIKVYIRSSLSCSNQIKCSVHI